MKIFETELKGEKIYVIHSGKFTKSEKELKEKIENAITCNKEKGFYRNKFYPIFINNQIIFAWFNKQYYVHFYFGKDHMTFNKKGQLIVKNTLFNSEMTHILDSVIEDNKFLKEREVFNYNVL